MKRKNLDWMTSGLIILCALMAPVSTAHENHAPVLAPWEEASIWPDRIIVNPGVDPTTGFSVTWRTDSSVSSAVAQLVKASGDSRFDAPADTFNARTEAVNLETTNTAYDRKFQPNAGRGIVHQHSVTFSKLEPDTLYAYRVRGMRGHWSEWFQVRTAPSDGPVSFLYFGDAQYGIRSHASRIFRQALLSAPTADFIIHAGDLVNKGERDTEWAEWYAANGFINGMLPVLPVAGNHEYLSTKDGGSKDGRAVLTDLWRPQFTLPQVGSLPEPLQETVYDLRYGDDLHVFVLDSSSPLWVEQMTWLEDASQASDATWKVVALHHSPFRPGLQGYANAPKRGEWHRARQDAFLAAAKNAEIDLVLAGHNHSYTRASYGENVGPGLPAPADRNVLGEARDVEMVVVVSISGAMSGGMTAERYNQNKSKFGADLALERWANNTPTYQVIDIDGPVLHYRSFLGTADLYDAFTLTRSSDGRKVLVNDDVVSSPVRRFETTGPYIEKNDLR